MSTVYFMQQNILYILLHNSELLSRHVMCSDLGHCFIFHPLALSLFVHDVVVPVWVDICQGLIRISSA